MGHGMWPLQEEVLFGGYLDMAVRKVAGLGGNLFWFAFSFVEK